MILLINPTNPRNISKGNQMTTRIIILIGRVARFIGGADAILGRVIRIRLTQIFCYHIIHDERQANASIYDDACTIKPLDNFIGTLSLAAIHMGTLQPYVQFKRQNNVKNRTINSGLQLVRHILNLASSEWLDEYGLTWLNSTPRIKLFPETDKRKPYPLSWDEQTRLINELPLHLKQMTLFAVNTGCRDQEICNLQWDWERKIPELYCSVFIVPDGRVKNREDRLVVLNRIACSVIEEVRGEDPKYVFTYKGSPIGRMLNSAWKKARIRAELPQV